MLTEDEVCQASDQFYAALNRVLNGDARPMMEVWPHNSDVTTMHPIGGREVAFTRRFLGKGGGTHSASIGVETDFCC